MDTQQTPQSDLSSFDPIHAYEGLSDALPQLTSRILVLTHSHLFALLERTEDYTPSPLVDLVVEQFSPEFITETVNSIRERGFGPTRWHDEKFLSYGLATKQEIYMAGGEVLTYLELTPAGYTASLLAMGREIAVMLDHDVDLIRETYRAGARHHEEIADEEMQAELEHELRLVQGQGSWLENLPYNVRINFDLMMRVSQGFPKAA